MNDLCVDCMSLVGGSRHVAPHAELRQVDRSTDAELFHCIICEAWWRIQKLGWGRAEVDN
jgi:hypothetical protein